MGKALNNKLPYIESISSYLYGMRDIMRTLLMVILIIGLIKQTLFLCKILDFLIVLYETKAD